LIPVVDCDNPKALYDFVTHSLYLIHTGFLSLIAVQGFGSRYPHTWEKESKDDKLKSILWLRDFLPQEFPDTRILAFDYPSQWFGDPDYTDLEICGGSLLDGIIKNTIVRLLDASKYSCAYLQMAARRTIDIHRS